MSDHVHMCISIPPKYAMSNVVGYLKGKRAIQIARKFGGRQKNFTGENFWARGYFVSTVGLDESLVRAYIRNQEDERHDQIKFIPLHTSLPRCFNRALSKNKGWR